MFDLTRFPGFLKMLMLGHYAAAAMRKGDPKRKSVKANRSSFYKETWINAAEIVGVEVEEFAPGIMEFDPDHARIRVRDNYTPLDDPVTLGIVGNKSLVHQKLRVHDLPMPDYLAYSLGTIKAAREFMNEQATACVVKPASGTGAGQGITTGITSANRLGLASAFAARFCSDLIIERQVPGSNFRFLYLDGQLLQAVRRDPPLVIGDGNSTISKLIKAENRRRVDDWEAAQTLIQKDRDLKTTLKLQNLKLSSVVEKGRRIPVKTVINDNSALDNQVVTKSVHPENIKLGAEAARLLGIRLAGVDIISPNIELPLQSNGGVLLEVNTTPGLYHHKQGRECPVAVPILRAMLTETPKPFAESTESTI